MRRRGGIARWFDAKLNDVCSDPVLFRTALIAAGVLALAWVGCVGLLMLRPVASPEMGAAAPPLASMVPPLAQDAPNSLSQPTEPEHYSNDFGPSPFTLGVPHQSRLDETPPPASTITPQAWKAPLQQAARTEDAAPLPPSRPQEFRPLARPSPGYDRWTAVYDISARAVYLPDGRKLEAHSGLGDRLDDPRFVNERDRGPTPPGTYELTLRESLFHGVQALRLTPLGDGDVFGRSGLLAHPYMLGPSGDSNGCVSFKDYDAFLQAFQDGQIKRLAVVSQRVQEAALLGRLDNQRLGPGN